MKNKLKLIHLSIITMIIVIAMSYISMTEIRSSVTRGTDNLTVNRSDNSLTVHFLDIGQADSMLIQIAGGYNVLIDAGNTEDADYIQNYLNKLEVKKIDALIQTHPHEDHIGSMDDIVENYNIGKIFAPKVEHPSKSNKDFLKAVSDRDLSLEYTRAGDSFHIGSAVFKVLSPDGEDYDDLNYHSIVINMYFGSTSFLFMGDAEGNVLNEIISNGFSLKADVLKVGHHGALPSTPLNFLSKVNPKIAVLTVRKNSYGYPHFTTLSNLSALGIRSHLTEGNGTVVVNSDGKNITAWRSNYKNTDKKSLEK